MQNVLMILAASVLGLSSLGCNSQDIPQAHKGRMFDKTGALAFYAGGVGFTGPVLGPGTYYTAAYPEIRMVDCSQQNPKEQLSALTKDGVQFSLDMYVQYSANCDNNDAVIALLSKVAPADGKLTVTAGQIYDLYIRSILGEAVRESVSPHNANDINNKREEIYAAITKRFREIIGKQSPQLVVIHSINLNNMNFPAEMIKANTERAVQGIYKDKAVAERDRVTAEIETAAMRRKLAENEGENEAVKIDKVGGALKRNPEYLQYSLQSVMPEIYKEAGQHGNLVITAPAPNVLVTPKTPAAPPAAK